MDHKERAFGLWELAVLSLLRERPMHPYEIQRLLKQRHKDDVLTLKKGSLYHAIRRLEAAGYISVRATTREGLRPERTTYQLEKSGEALLLEWLRERISRPHRQCSDFMGSLSFLVHLHPEEATVELERRLSALDADIAATEGVLAEARPHVPRIHLIESEYLQTMRGAEREWVRALLRDLKSGRLSWDIAAILKYLRAAVPKSKTRVARK